MLSKADFDRLLVMADSKLEQKKKIISEFEQIVRNWPRGKSGIVEAIEYLEREKKNLQAMKRRRKAKKGSVSEKDVIKFAEQLGYVAEPSNRKQAQQAVKSDQTVVDMWREKSEADVASARSKQASAKRRLASQLNTFNRCPYCETKLSFDQSHVDHIHPVSKGGLSEDDNLVLVCASCNTSKGKKTLRAFCRDTDLNYDVVVARLEMIGKAV